MFRRKRKEEEPVDKNKELFEERVQEFLKDLREKRDYQEECREYHIYQLVEIFSGKIEGDLQELVGKEAIRHNRAMKWSETYDWVYRNLGSEGHKKRVEAAMDRAKEIFQQELEGHFENE